MRLVVCVLVLAFSVPSAGGQEYPISNPTQASSAPVHLTRPTAGTVDVSNLPEVQDVRIVGGKLEGPVEVTGEVGIRTTTPLAVEITNPQKASREVQVVGPVKLDDTQPVRVWVDNSWNPESPAGQEFAVLAFQSRFLPSDDRHRRAVSPRGGKVFHLTDLVVDVRPDAQLKVRLLAAPKSVGGAVSGVEYAEFPLGVLDTRRATSLRFSTPVPIVGDFTLEVEVLSANQGGYFSVVALGYYAPKP